MKTDTEISKAELTIEEVEKGLKQGKERLKKEENKDLKQVIPKSEDIEIVSTPRQPPIKPRRVELKIPEIRGENLLEQDKIVKSVQLEKVQRAKLKKIHTGIEPIEIREVLELSFPAEIGVRKPPLISPKDIIKREIPEVGKDLLSFESLEIAVKKSSTAPRLTIKKEIPEIENDLLSPRENNLEIRRASDFSVSGIRIKALEAPKVTKEDKEAASEKSVTTQEAQQVDEGPPDEIFVPPFLNVMSSAARPIDRPVCIVLPKKKDDSFVHSIALICREIYRIVKGGKPIPRWISKGLKEEIEGYLKAGDRIFVIDDSKGNLLPGLGNVKSCTDLIKRIDEEKLLDRLKELFSQDLGFIIFHLDERFAGQFANLLREEVGAFIDIIEVQIPDLQQEAKEFFAKACWGFVEGRGGTFDEFFGSCEKTFFSELNRAREDVELSHYVERDENASPEHESAKILVVKYLAKELGAKDKSEIIKMLKNRELETEYELNGERADIYVPSQGRYVEIETFYGTGDPIDKLEKTLKKYREHEIKGRVDVVLLTGIQAFLYARRLFNLAKIYHEEYGLEVDFYLLDLKEEKLIPLRQVLSRLKEILGSSEHAMLTDDEVERLWNEFSNALLKCGKNPEDYRKLFDIIIVRYKSFKENLRWMLEEIDIICRHFQKTNLRIFASTRSSG